jgi:hypothetical protein
MDTLTAASRALLDAFWADRDNWAGNPLVDITSSQRGNLTDLKVKGYLTTFEYEPGFHFVEFTPKTFAMYSEEPEGRFATDSRVRLLANDEEGWPEEFGVVLSHDGDAGYMVAVDEQYRDGPHDDGLREVTEDQMEAQR